MEEKINIKQDYTNLRTKSAEKREPEVTDGEREVLVEEVPQELAHPVVGPPAVDQQ